MEPATKKRKSIMEDGFELLSRIYRWSDIEVDKVFKVKQIVHGKALLEDNNGEQLITELPGSVLEKISGDKDLSVFLKKTLEDVIVGFIPKKKCTLCRKYFANDSSLHSHQKRCRRKRQMWSTLIKLVSLF